MTTATPPFDAAALARTLSDEAKDALLIELIREVAQMYAQSGPIPFVAPDGECLGYYMSLAAARAQLRQLGLDQHDGRAAVDAYLANPDAVLTFEEVQAWADAQEDLDESQQSAPAAAALEAARSDGPA